jgi:hypothetical protein
MKLTIQEEKELICKAIKDQVTEYNEYPYIYSVVIFGFYNNEGKKLTVPEIKRFWDKNEVQRTCQHIYNTLKDTLDITQIFTFIERHSPLIDDAGEVIKEGRFHLNIITTDIHDRHIEEPNRKIRRLMGSNNGIGIPIQNMVGDIERIKLELFNAVVRKSEWVNKFQYSVKTQYLETKDDVERTVDYCLKDYIHKKVDFADIIVSKSSDFYKP